MPIRIIWLAGIGVAGLVAYLVLKRDSITAPSYPADPGLLAQMVLQNVRTMKKNYNHELIRRFQFAAGIADEQTGQASGLFDITTRTALLAYGIHEAELENVPAYKKSGEPYLPGLGNDIAEGLETAAKVAPGVIKALSGFFGGSSDEAKPKVRRSSEQNPSYDRPEGFSAYPRAMLATASDGDLAALMQQGQITQAEYNLALQDREYIS